MRPRRGEVERLFLDAIDEITPVERKPQFPWLSNKFDPNDPRNEVLGEIFIKLDGHIDAMTVKPLRRLTSDAFLPQLNCLLEIDEIQHFTRERAAALREYPKDLLVGFDVRKYTDDCLDHDESARKKVASGYRKPVTEFPFDGGRHAQRALFDAFRDVLAPQHDLKTIRIAAHDLQLPKNGHSRAEFVANLEEYLRAFTKLGRA